MGRDSPPMPGGKALPETRNGAPKRYADVKDVVRDILDRTGGDVRLALPLGLGKANTIANALTQAALDDASITLSIFTALTLERPAIGENEMQRRFLEPAMDRLFGQYPDLLYARMMRDGELPANITISEFFFMAGRWLGVERAQRNYICANYTHALHYIAARRPNVIAQLLAADGERFSLSCNTDITSDLLTMRREGKADFILAGECNSELPFMPGSGECQKGDIDMLLDDPQTDFELFSAVKRPVEPADHAIGLHVAGLVRDGGTLQIGIGSIGDAVAEALLLRHRRPEAFRDLVSASPFPVDSGFAESGSFVEGLYGLTEMLTDGMLHLFEEGIVARKVDDAAIHAGFLLGCRDFYRRLREMPEERRAAIAMMPVSFTNALYGDEPAKRHARREARFVNNAMMATLTGAVVSDGLDNGEVVSGVGGQYNFVAQSFALEGARSVITLNATRESGGESVSNIVWRYAHQTIPRHLRDIVVTEYGVADLRGKADAEVIAALVNVADSRFQEGLLEQARSAGKIAADHTVPEAHRANTPERLRKWLEPARAAGDLSPYPFGTDFTAVEQRLLPALGLLRNAATSRRKLAALVMQGFSVNVEAPATAQALERMGLARPAGFRERLSALALRGALSQTEPVH